MDPVVLLVVFAVTVIAAYIFGRATAPSGEDSSLSAPSDVAPSAFARAQGASAATREEIATLRAQANEAEKTAKQVESELRKVREELKEAKQRAHDRGQRLEQTRKELEEERRKAKSLGSIESTRQEMLTARAEVERLEGELRRLQSSAVAAPARNQAPAEPTEVDAAREESETIRRYESILEARDREFRSDFRAQADELRASFNQQVSEERTRAKEEIRSLQSRLRTALRDVARERRRSEANDRAYLILKSQLEGTLDRLALHDPTLRRPDGLDRPQAPAGAASDTPDA